MENFKQVDRRLERVIVAGVLVLVASIALVYGGPYLADFFTAKLALLHAGIGLLVGVWIFRCGIAARVEFKWQPYYLPLVVYVGISLCSLWWAVNPRQGLEVWLAQVWLLAFFLLVARHFQTAVWGVLWTIAATSFAVSVIGVLQFRGIHLVPMPHGHWGNFGVSTLGNPNFVAHYLELSIVLLAGMGLARRRVWERLGLGALLLFEIYYLLLTRSRGGWLAVGVGLVALFFLYRPEVSRRVLLAGGLAVLVLLGGGHALLNRVSPSGAGGLLWELRQVRDRALSSFNLEHFSVVQRRLIWADTVALIADQPILGVGTGNYEFSIPAYRPATRHRAWAKLIGDRPHMPYYAHNEYLEIWAENGIFGLAAALWLLGGVLWVGWRRLQAEEEAASRALQASFLAALLAALTHSIFSLNLQDPTSALHFWLIAGLAVGGGPGSTVFAVGPRRRWLALGAVVPVVLGAYWGLCILIADYYYFDGQRNYYDFNKPNRAGLSFAQAIQWREHDFRYHHMLGLIELGARRPAEAARVLERVRELHPNNASALRLLGQALYWDHREEEAIAVLRRSIKLDPLDQEPYPLLARAYHDRGLRHRGAGDAEGAQEAFRRAIATWQQALAFAPENADFLRSLGIEYFSAELLADAEVVLVRAASLRPGDGIIQGNLGGVYLGLGRHEEAEAALLRAVELDPQRAEWWGNLALLYGKQGRLEEAEEALRNAARLDPANLRWHLRLIELLRRQGRIEEALRAAEVALEAQPQNERLAQMLRELRQRLQKGER